MRYRLILMFVFILAFQPVQALDNPGQIATVQYHQFIVSDISNVDFFPSDIKTINITLQNIYNYSAFGVSTVIDKDKADPIKITHELQKYAGKEIKGNEKFTVQYEVYIKDSVPKGTYYIPLSVIWTFVEGGTVVRQEDLYIGIKVTENPEVIKIETLNVTTIPAHIRSGDAFQIKIQLKNIGNTNLNQIRAALDVKLPFSSVGSSTEQFIPSLKSGQTEEVSYNILVDKSTPSRIYNFNFSLDFRDSSNRLSSQQNSFGINVEEASEVYIQDVTINPTTLNPGSEGLLMVQIANAGTNEVKNVRVTVFGGDMILTQTQNFIGIIQSGPKASETASFGVLIDPEIESGDYGLTIQINYDDINGVHNTKSSLYLIKISDKSSLIPISTSTLTGIIYMILYAFFSYGIFLIVGSQINKKHEISTNKKSILIIIFIFLIVQVPFQITSNAGESGIVINSESRGINTLPNDIKDILIYKQDFYHIVLIEDPITQVSKTGDIVSKERKLVLSKNEPKKGSFVKVTNITTDMYVSSYGIISESYEKLIIGDIYEARFGSLIMDLNDFAQQLNSWTSTTLFSFSEILLISKMVFFTGGFVVIMIITFLFHGKIKLWNIFGIATLYSIQFFIANMIAILNRIYIEPTTLIFGILFIITLPLTFMIQKYEETEKGSQRIQELYILNNKMWSNIRKKL